MATFKEFFRESITEIQKHDDGLLAAIVSENGLIVDTSLEDEAELKQLAAFVSAFIDFGTRIFSLDYFEKASDSSNLTTWVGSGLNRFVVVTQFLGGTFFVILGKDHAAISSSAEKVMDLISKAEPDLQNGNFKL